MKSKIKIESFAFNETGAAAVFNVLLCLVLIFLFIKRVDEGRITTVKILES